MLLATFKHISSKNADYSAAEAYLTFEHDEFTMKPTLDENGRLTDIDERMKIGWMPDGRIADMNCEPPKEYAPQTPVSMNCWGCPVELMQEFAPRFVRFLDTMHDPLKSEYLLPEVIGALLREGRAEVTVLPVHNKWYGVTYREDHEKVVAAMAALTAEGLYPEVLK